MAVYRPGLGREAPRDAQQNAIDIVAGLTPAANRIGLKQVFQKYGDITVCWLPPVDKRNEMAAYIRYENSDCAKAALAACDSGEVVLNGIPLKAEYRSRGASSASSAYAARERGGYNRSGKRRSYGALSSRSRSRERRRAKYGYSSSSSSSRSRSRSYSGGRRSRSYDSRDGSRSRRHRGGDRRSRSRSNSRDRSRREDRRSSDYYRRRSDSRQDRRYSPYERYGRSGGGGARESRDGGDRR